MSGTIEVPGLAAPVRVVRDGAGVPHIYAQGQDDLFFAQGYVQAQDRLFQMDLWRRSSQGRLSEVLGPNFVERDAMTRRMQYRGDLGAEWASYGPDTRAIAEAFVRGINAWVALARDRPPEEFVHAGWKPELWAAEDLLNRTDAFVAGGDAIDEVFRARLVAAVGAPRIGVLLPGNRPMAVPPDLDVTTIDPVVGDAIRRVGTAPFFVGLAARVPGAPLEAERGAVRPKPAETTGQPAPPRAERASASLAGAPAGGGPDTTPDGAVRTLENPSRRYLVHLSAPGWNVVGATSPWLPGVAVGHNDRFAWDAAPVDADTQDVFVVKLNPSRPHQVDDNGRWADTEIVKDTIVIRANPKPFAFETEHTRHGVIVASDRARGLAFALRWSGSEPGTAAELAALAIDRASSVAEITAAIARWKLPARRITYAGVDGARGSQVAALVPLRRGWSGALPAPAWTGANEWVGWQPQAAETTNGSPDTPAATLARWARAHPDRADQLLAKLAAAAAARDAVKLQRALLAEARAEAVREAEQPTQSVVFAHPLGITDAARRRFNVGPLSPAAGSTGSPARLALYAVMSDVANWDRSTAMNAPGQSGSPGGAHFGDLGTRWAAGQAIALPFSEAAVQADAESTLTLTSERTRN